MHNGFGRRDLATVVGLLVVLAGVVSSAAIVNGFVGYLEIFVEAPRWLVITVLVLAFGALAAWGIVESVTAAAFLTLLEMAGLALVIWVARDALATLPARGGELVPAWGGAAPIAILTGAVLAFYAFIGFEDLVNVAEEVKNVSRNMPRAIVLTLVVTTLFYLLLSLVAVLAVPPDDLRASEAPLALVYERSTGSAATIISLIGLVAIVNGALIQIIMASRVMYGLANKGWLPARLAQVHPRRHTPILATGLVTITVLVFALWLPIVTLAQATSLVALIVFALVNLSLFRVKLRGEPAPAGAMQTPFWLPPLGFVVSGGFAIYQAALFAGVG